MTPIKPLYLLFCEGSLGQRGSHPMDERGRWRFVLENVETGTRIEASDVETMGHPDRTSLLAVMRGLEALDQPSRVTLITTNRYVARGLQYGLVEWRENDYCWEHFGSVQPVRNADLWRRIDVALRFHEVQCRWMSQDPVTGLEEGDAREVMVPGETLNTGSRDAVEGDPREADGFQGTAVHPKPAVFPRLGAEMVRGRRASSRSRERTLSFTASLQSESTEMSAAHANSEGLSADAHRGVTASVGLEPQYGLQSGEVDARVAESDAGLSSAGLSRARRHFDPRGSQTEIDEDDRREDTFGGGEVDAVASIAVRGHGVTDAASGESQSESFDMRRLGQNAVPSMILEARKPRLLWMPMRWTWGLILGLDALLVSFLQCMFLMDPRREEYRSK